MLFFFSGTKENTENLIINIDLKEVKSSGHFLDGCGVSKF